MEGKFTVLENETDVLWIDKDTYTVARLKELVGDEIKKKFSANFTIAENNNTYNRNFRSYSNTIQINQLTLNTKSMTWNSDIIQQNNCQLLKVGSKGWQKGKLKINSI
ncbi:MAG: KGK domain-containing protein [Halothece sp.]